MVDDLLEIPVDRHVAPEIGGPPVVGVQGVGRDRPVAVERAGDRRVVHAGVEVVHAHGAGQDAGTGVEPADLDRGGVDERHDRPRLARGVQLVAELPGPDDIPGAALDDRADDLAHEGEVGAAPVLLIERQQELVVVVHPAEAVRSLAGHRLVVVDQRHDQLEPGGAQGRRDVGDTVAESLAVPVDELAGVGGEDPDHGSVEPAGVGDVLVEIGDVLVEHGAVHVEDQEAAIEGAGLPSRGVRQVAGRRELGGGGNLIPDRDRPAFGRGLDRRAGWACPPAERLGWIFGCVRAWREPERDQ